MKKLTNPQAAPLLNLVEVDAALGKIFGLKNSIDAVDAATTQAINKIKDEAQNQMLSWAGEILSLEIAITNFVEANRAQLFDKTKSLKLNLGVIGYRFSSHLEIKEPMTTIEKIRKFFSRRAKAAIIVKEKPNKNFLENWTDAELKKVGCKRVSGDEFYYEPVEAGMSTASA